MADEPDTVVTSTDEGGALGEPTPGELSPPVSGEAEEAESTPRTRPRRRKRDVKRTTKKHAPRKRKATAKRKKLVRKKTGRRRAS